MTLYFSVICNTFLATLQTFPCDYLPVEGVQTRLPVMICHSFCIRACGALCFHVPRKRIMSGLNLDNKGGGVTTPETLSRAFLEASRMIRNKIYGVGKLRLALLRHFDDAPPPPDFQPNPPDPRFGARCLSWI